VLNNYKPTIKAGKRFITSDSDIKGGKLEKIASKGGGRVFWSGGDVAKNAAMDFAKANGMKTLEMTTGGRIMNTVSPYLPRSISSRIWDGLSRNFARGASGNINVFQNAAGVSLKALGEGLNTQSYKTITFFITL
jgi:hypothetical protein